MRQRGVPLRVRHLEVEALDHAAALDAGPLGRDASPGMAAAQQVSVRQHPVGRGVEPAGDVQPLHNQSAAEVRIVARAAQQDARGERRLVRRQGGPPAIRAALAGKPVAVRGPRERELLLDVAERGEVVGASRHGNGAGQRAEGGGHRTVLLPGLKAGNGAA